MSEPLLQAPGIGGQLAVFDDKVVISRRGVLGLVNHGLKGDKEIRISQISSIQFKKAGMVNGYIQFAFLGGHEAKGGVFQATQDENTVMFTTTQQKLFVEAKALIEQLMSRASAPAPAAAPAEDIPKKLEQLTQLKNSGIISEDDYSRKKAELLARM